MAHAVVGLGNPGSEYRDTRHNVGQRVLDLLAQTIHASPWAREGQALVARGRWRQQTIHLVKPQTFMNLSGPVVAATVRRLHDGPEDTILVYDDIDLALGRVRLRLRGSSGGHNGMESVIAALGTEEIKRVKVGIGRPAHKRQVPDHVLTPFEEDEREIVEQAVALAAQRVLGLVMGHPAR
ncbi:MAG: aminoacyl-tRNA hydrolase [Candidatus Rokubacteria bacterium]|nr:aminoacyl-tRNA hydrolase [Candidatus Rokubacteria bacterium]MBI3827024.1 aminoacyl-tRNA hydrolase [Candidatus Rokubacteria bacterium]